MNLCLLLRRFLLVVPLLLVAAVVSAQGEAKIVPGQLIRISCEEEPLITRDYRVTQKGFVLVDFLGAVKVAGLSKPEAAQTVGDMLVGSKVLKKATVKVDEAVSNSGGDTTSGSTVAWSGEVDNPGSVRFRPGITLAEVWPNVRSRSGADLTQVTITNPGAAPRVVPVGVASDLRAVVLRAGDTIVLGARPSTVGRATVLGEVLRPGSVEVGPYATVGELVGLAGGLTGNANPDKVQLTRTGGESKTLTLPNDASFRVLPGDSLTIDTKMARFSIQVSGGVNRPGTVELVEGQGLIQVISQAGGTAPGAGKDKVRVFSPGQGKPRVVDLNQIELGYSGDMPLKPGMKVEVPTGKGALANSTVKYAVGAAVLLFLLGR